MFRVTYFVGGLSPSFLGRFSIWAHRFWQGDVKHHNSLTRVSGHQLSKIGSWPDVVKMMSLPSPVPASCSEDSQADAAGHIRGHRTESAFLLEQPLFSSRPQGSR